MLRLLETIRYENHRFFNLKRHIDRMNRSRKVLFGIEKPIATAEVLERSKLQARRLGAGLYKCRIIYAKEIEKSEFVPYQLPLIRSLKIVTDDNIDYSFKYLDRKPLERLYERRGVYDDILIVKNGLITDTYFANILFYNGTKWITPAHPLLKGTQRQYLLEINQIIMADIRPSDLKNFQKARLINAMNRFEAELDIKINDLKF